MKNTTASLPAFRSFALTLGTSLLFTLPAHAIKGTYLPESMLPKNVCKLMVGKIVTTYTPTFGNNVSNGWPAIVDEATLDGPMCSGSLIANNVFLTAAHCYQGNNEQHMGKGKFFYPKQNKDGVREAGCEGNDWYKKPECVIKVKGTVQEKWTDVRVECPTLDGKTESRPLEVNMGFPNPLFSTDGQIGSVSSANYDVTVWKFREPLLNSPLATPEFDIDSMQAATAKNWQSCKSFGYGRDNKEEAGVFRGAVTPIVSLTPMMLLSDDRAPITPTPYGVGRTDHGDSGGALVCKAVDGTEKLFGVVSRGGIAPSRGPMGFEHLNAQTGPQAEDPNAEHRSYYASTAYNAPWIQMVMNSTMLERDGSREQWYQLIHQYIRDELGRNVETAEECVQENRSKMTRSSYRDIYQFGYASLQSQIQKIESEYAQDQNAGMYYAKIQDVLHLAKQMDFNCQQGMGFDH